MNDHRVDKDAFLYSAVSSHWDCSKRFTLHPLADMFIPTPFGFIWEAFSHAALIARRLFVHISISVCSQVLIYTAERTVTMWNERNCQSFEMAGRGSEPGFSRLRPRRSYRYATDPVVSEASHIKFFDLSRKQRVHRGVAQDLLSQLYPCGVDRGARPHKFKL